MTHINGIGICLGAATVSAVVVDSDGTVQNLVQIVHEGNPEESLLKILSQVDTGDTPILVTGRKFRHFVALPTISETEAVEYALTGIDTDAAEPLDVVITAGAESFIAYLLDPKRRVTGISTGNKCASGTGEFFLQQIRRMGLSVEQAVIEADNGDAYHVSGRCSVFCKSDCTHALNKGESIADVSSGLCKMIAGKVIDLLAQIPHERVMLVGGLSRNTVVVDFIRDQVPRLEIPNEAPYFEALGAAIGARKKGAVLSGSPLRDKRSSFRFLEPLETYRNLVTFAPAVRGKIDATSRYIVGLDVGSTTTKAVLLDIENNAVCASVYLRTNGNPVHASQECFRSIHTQICEQVSGSAVSIVGIGVTGSGRKIAGLFSGSNNIINEIIAHATGAIHFDKEVDTIFEIGGQDAKYTYISHGIPSDYAMNEACSAGTGSFLEEAALESLGIAVTEIAEIALRGDHPPNFSDQCSAFISSDIKTATHEGIGREDISAGLVYSIGFNYLNRVKANRPVGEKVFMQGGVCYNQAVPLAIAGILQKPIIVPPDPGLMGAFGVALEVVKRLDSGTTDIQAIDLPALAERTIEYGKSFICAGGREKCDLKCRISRISIEGKTHPFGGACDRYYNQQIDRHPDESKLDWIGWRNRLAFKRSDMKQSSQDGSDKKGMAMVANALPKKERKIGISTSFFTQRLYPLYDAFFTYLGFDIVLSDSVNEEAFNRQTSSMCYPGEVALGLFDDLLNKQPDILFLPHVKELYVEGGNHKPWFCSTCILSQGEPYWLQRAFEDRLESATILAPTLNFNGGWENGADSFIGMAGDLGVTKRNAKRAFEHAIAVYTSYLAVCSDQGKTILDELHAHPEMTGVVIFGRSYNSLASEANKGIPKKLTSRGQLVIPYEMLPYQDVPMEGEYGEYMHWEAGQRMLKAAELVNKDPQLYGVFITNFLCAPDSFITQYFRKIMDSKPNLILELDAHTADAGLNTRIEAFLDIVRNYRGLDSSARIHPSSNGFKLARIQMENRGNFYIDSQGERLRLDHESVKLILPSMGDLASKAVACACERFGIHTADLPVANSEVLHKGRGVSTGKECLPYMICAGAVLTYLESRPADERTILMMPKASGYCRFGQYHVALNYLAKEKQIKNLAMLSLGMEEQWAGLGAGFTLIAWKAILISDIMDDIRNAITALAVDLEAGFERFEQVFDMLCDVIRGVDKTPFYRALQIAAESLSEIELRAPLDSVAEIAMTGEIYVRRDTFSNLGIVRRLADKGFLVRTAPVHEWIYYANYLIKQGLTKPDFRLPGYIEFIISDKVQVRVEKKIKRILERSGLYKSEIIDIEDTLKYMRHLIGKELTGEAELISGMVLRDALNHYAGVICIGPFGCMQTRFAEAISEPVSTVGAKREAWRYAGKELDLAEYEDSDRIPFLAIESDGNPFPQLLDARFENFCLQASRVAEKQHKQLSNVD